nr:reverse transcriptase domain-containing protein [Tanacetum cinerariifolium]
GVQGGDGVNRLNEWCLVAACGGRSEEHKLEDEDEDLSEEHEPEDDNEDLGEDPNEEPEPEDEDTKEGELSEGSDETEPFEEDETAITPPPPRHRGARISVRPHTPMAASTQALIDAFAAGSPLFPLPPTSPAYDQAPLGHRATMIRKRDDIPEEDMPPQRIFVFTAPSPGCDVAESSAAARAPRGQYDFVDTVDAGQGLIRSPGHDAWTIARAADRVEDVGYVRAFYASEHMMMTSIEEVNLRISYQAQVRRQESKYFYTQLHDAQTDRRDIRLEIDVVRGQRTAYETEMQESAEDLAVTQMMRIYALEVRARTDTVEDAGSSCHDAAYGMTWGTLKKKLKDKYCPKGEIKKLEIKLWNLKVKGNDIVAYTQCFQELALMSIKFLADETEKVDKYISGLPDNIHWNVMSARPMTLDETIELANDLMDKKLRTYAERTGYFKKNCPKLKNNDNANGNGGARGKAYVLAGGDSNPETNTVTDNHYDVKLADGKIIGVNTILRGCTLDFLNHPFNIDLMPVPLGSFDVIIGMDWLREYHAVIVCDEKIVRVPFENETLIFKAKETI